MLFVLVFVGSGPEEEHVRDLASNLGVLKQVRFLGQRSDVAELMLVEDLFVLPSLFEVLPLAVLEAM